MAENLQIVFTGANPDNDPDLPPGLRLTGWVFQVNTGWWRGLIQYSDDTRPYPVSEQVGPFPTRAEATEAAKMFAFERFGLVPQQPSKRTTCTCRKRRR